MNENADLYVQLLSYRSNAAPRACLAAPWFVRARHPVYYPRYRCHIEPLICGEEVFRRISQDIERAAQSVDIITWGFDPGMVLIRGVHAEDGMRYGDLLKQIATRKEHPVIVRLLVWHDDFVAHELMKNNPGYFGARFPSIDCALTDHYSERHKAYNAQWFSDIRANKFPRIQLHIRKVPTKFRERSLAGESVPTGINAKVSQWYATHHQKMVLIDYEIPKWAVGYVMGHNSVTDFWDTREHKFKDKRRERFYTNGQAGLENHLEHMKIQYARYLSKPGAARDMMERRIANYIGTHSHIAKPYQDVSCRLQGPVLFDLNHNFCEAWKDSTRPGPDVDFANLLRSVQHRPNTNAPASDFPFDELDHYFSATRDDLRPEAFNIEHGQHNAQILRTQPICGEKAIKECYANLTRQLHHYFFIQNQYIQYKPWAEHLLECVSNLRKGGYHAPIYVFLLTSTPESNGMDIPTYDVASQIGKSNTMRVEHNEAVESARQKGIKPPITSEELSVQGISVFMGSLWTCAQKDGKLERDDYEEIYIHAKVAIVDDAAFTIGSANLNLRSMALDSELNVLSEATDVAYALRMELFSQCNGGDSGPIQFGDMESTFRSWTARAKLNLKNRESGKRLISQLLPFYVDRKPGEPVM